MNIRIELLTLQTGANKLSAAEFYAKFAAIADEYIRLQNLQQTECDTHVCHEHDSYVDDDNFWKCRICDKIVD